MKKSTPKVSMPVTKGLAAAWGASDVLHCIAMAY